MNETQKKLEELKEAALPLLNFLNEHYCPHTYALVTEGRVEILEGSMFAVLPVRD